MNYIGPGPVGFATCVLGLWLRGVEHGESERNKPEQEHVRPGHRSCRGDYVRCDVCDGLVDTRGGEHGQIFVVPGLVRWVSE